MELKSHNNAYFIIININNSEKQSFWMHKAQENMSQLMNLINMTFNSEI